jgi:hypothetical protein
MPTTETILEILDFIRLNESTLTTHQLYAYFEKNNLLKQLVYAFPFMVKGHVLAFETLLSKAVVTQAYMERPENIDKDIIESMSNRQY